MNLTESTIDYEKYNILQYKKYQQSLIKYFFDLTLKYLKTNGFKYDNYEQIFTHKSMYKEICYSNLYNLKIMIDGSEYYNLDIPRLTNNFYILNGAKYIPAIYVVDYPVIYKKDKKNKKSSVSIYSIFNQIELLFSTGTAKLFLHTIPINRLLSLYYDDIFHNTICEKTNLPYKKYEKDENIKWFKKEYHLSQNEDIFDKFNKLFLDEFTQNLYNECYKTEVETLKDVLDITFDIIINDKKPSFIDLNYKRLIFIEALLRPVFKATQHYLKLMESKTLIARSNIKANAILQWFNTGLERNFQYLDASPITAINTLKCSFKSPLSNMKSDKMPSEISSIHPSFYGKICTVSVSAKNTGVVCHLIPEQTVNLLTGQFLI